MDYCSSCRRHLNGALVCPGCGAYAPDIAPATTDGRIVPARATGTPASAAASWFTPTDRWHGGHLRDEGEAAVEPGRDEDPYSAPADDLRGVTLAPQGRAARRRQMARWKKNQRRAVVATAVALVGGGLTVSAMDRQSADGAQAATAPETTSMGTAEKPVTQQPHPSSTRPETHRSSQTPPAQPASADLRRRQPAAATPRTTPPNTRPDAAASPRATSVPQPRTTSPSSAETIPDHTATPPKQTSTPPAATGADSGTSQASPAPTATAPSKICLLVVCIG